MSAGRVVEYFGNRRLLEVDDARERPLGVKRYTVQVQAAPLDPWVAILTTNDPELAFDTLHAGRVARVEL